MPDLSGKTIAILSTHGFEQSELESPLAQLAEWGATVHVIAPEGGEIRGWEGKDWGRTVAVDKTVDEADADAYDALVLPGGQINPDILRADEKAMEFIKRSLSRGSTVAAICHAPWLLIEAGAAKGLKATSYKSIRTDMINAGAHWEDSAVVCDHGIITSRNPDDLEAFNAKIAEEVLEGTHHERRAA